MLVVNDPEQQPYVTVHPTGERVLIRVLEEADGAIIVPASYAKGHGRSMQGVIVALGLRVSEPDIVEAFRRQVPVIFNDQVSSPWWKGSLMPNYLGAVLDEGEEYVLIPVEHILCTLEDDNGGDHRQ